MKKLTLIIFLGLILCSNSLAAQMITVKVNGMVCDFCARGIEKTFKKDIGVKKIDVDLANGKVLIAYAATAKIVNEDIEQKILSNGQTVTDIQILTAQ